MNLKSIDELTENLHMLPGIGRRTAERISYLLLEMDEEKVDAIIDSIKRVKEDIHLCPICGAYMEDKCVFCSDENRDKNMLMVVTSYKDALAFERLNSYHGLYHILRGNISPSKGIDSKDLHIDELIKRIKDDGIKEVVLATEPNIEGETTALYIAKRLENENVIVSRLAYGLPMGGHLTYADDLTLLRSFEGRKSLK